MVTLMDPPPRTPSVGTRELVGKKSRASKLLRARVIAPGMPIQTVSFSPGSPAREIFAQAGLSNLEGRPGLGFRQGSLTIDLDEPILVECDLAVAPQIVGG